jgi:hypothetical protein
MQEDSASAVSTKHGINAPLKPAWLLVLFYFVESNLFIFAQLTIIPNHGLALSELLDDAVGAVGFLEKKFSSLSRKFASRFTITLAGAGESRAGLTLTGFDAGGTVVQAQLTSTHSGTIRCHLLVRIAEFPFVVDADIGHRLHVQTLGLSGFGLQALDGGVGGLYFFVFALLPFRALGHGAVVALPGADGDEAGQPDEGGDRVVVHAFSSSASAAAEVISASE